MSPPDAFADAIALIRAGQTDQALNLLETALPDLPHEHHRKAWSYAGLACYFAERWTEALAYFERAAVGSAIPEDHFNVAMCQVRLGAIELAHQAWTRVFELSYAHQDAPETSSFFQKKLMFAQILSEAGACDARGLDLVARQLMGFYTSNQITDPGFWHVRGVPPFDEVLGLTRTYYQALGKSEAEWLALLDEIGAKVDDEGREVIEGLRAYRE